MLFFFYLYPYTFDIYISHLFGAALLYLSLYKTFTRGSFTHSGKDVSILAGLAAEFCLLIRSTNLFQFRCEKVDVYLQAAQVDIHKKKLKHVPHTCRQQNLTQWLRMSDSGFLLVFSKAGSKYWMHRAPAARSMSGSGKAKSKAEMLIVHKGFRKRKRKNPNEPPCQSKKQH